MEHTVMGFTAEEWRTVMQGVGNLATAVIGAVGLAYARLAMKRAKAAATAANDSVESSGRTETEVRGSTEDLSAQLEGLRTQVSSLVRSGARAVTPPPLRAPAAPVAPRAAEPAPEPAETPAAPERPSEAAGGRLDTSAVWTMLGGR